MILASIDWLSISINLLLILFVISALLMSLLILMQRPKQEGLGAAFGSGMTNEVFGARTTSVLQKGTVYLGSLFFILTLTLAILFARKNERDNAQTLVQEDLPAEEQIEPPPAVEPEPVPSLEESLEGQLEPATGETPAIDDQEDPGAADETPAGQTPVEESSADETPAEQTPANEPAADEPAADEPAADEPAADEPAADEPSTGEEPAGEEPDGEEPAGEESAGEESAGEESAGEESAGEEAGTEPASEEPGQP